LKSIVLKDSTSIILDQIIQSLSEGVNVTDMNGNIIYANEKSAKYANTTIQDMLGNHISNFYPKAVILKVLDSQEPYTNIDVEHPDGRHYIVNALPLIIKDQFKGALAIFRDVTEIKIMNNEITNLKEKLNKKFSSNIFDKFIGSDNSLNNVVNKACKAIGSPGGPRHSIILGETGTGKTFLAKLMYEFAKNIGVIKSNAPFIEINCAQFTNPDIAAAEIFGATKGSFTGATNKSGFIEEANGGILFLDEAHALKNYQNLLLKVVEEQKVRKIGGKKNIPVNVIIIAASTQNLEAKLLPELYQRLAQYRLILSSFDKRPYSEKEKMFLHFKDEYKKNAHEKYNIDLEIIFDPNAREKLLNQKYKRNVRHFKDTINLSIDNATPLISNFEKKELTIIVKNKHIPEKINYSFNSVNDEDNLNKKKKKNQKNMEKYLIENENDLEIKKLITYYRDKGYGARKIAQYLQNKGIDMKYYQVSYRLRKYDI